MLYFISCVMFVCFSNAAEYSMNSFDINISETDITDFFSNAFRVQSKIQCSVECCLLNSRSMLFDYKDNLCSCFKCITTSVLEGRRIAVVSQQTAGTIKAGMDLSVSVLIHNINLCKLRSYKRSPLSQKLTKPIKN